MPEDRFDGVRSLVRRMASESEKASPSVHLLMALHKSLGISLQEMYDRGIR